MLGCVAFKKTKVGGGGEIPLVGFPRTGGDRRPTSEPRSQAEESPQREDVKDEEREEVEDDGPYTVDRGALALAIPRAPGATARGWRKRPRRPWSRLDGARRLKVDPWALCGYSCEVTSTPRVGRSVAAKAAGSIEEPENRGRRGGFSATGRR